MHRFLFTLKRKLERGQGADRMNVKAYDIIGATKTVALARPGAEILAAVGVDAQGFETLAVNPTQRRVIQAHDLSVRVGQLRPPQSYANDTRDCLPTRYEVLVHDHRWRRVYSTRHTGQHFIVLGRLKVLVQLPEGI